MAALNKPTPVCPCALLDPIPNAWRRTVTYPVEGGEAAPASKRQRSPGPWKRKPRDAPRGVLAGCCLARRHQSHPQSTPMGKGLAAVHLDQRERDHRKAPEARTGSRVPTWGLLLWSTETPLFAGAGPDPQPRSCCFSIWPPSPGSHKDTFLSRLWIISIVFSRKHNFCKAFLKTNTSGLSHSVTTPNKHHFNLLSLHTNTTRTSSQLDRSI